MKKLVLPLAVIGAVAMVGGGSAGAAPAGKTNLCHVNGKGEYVKISVSNKAVSAHEAHGDVAAGEPGVVDQDCNEVTRVSSGDMAFGSNGWAGWSCPAGMTAVGGGTTLAGVSDEGVAAPGNTIDGFTYPVFPHYTFAPGETGYVVHADNSGGTGEVFVDCV
ncbi:MAG: hypothetical protein ACRDJY_08690 [Thermoleophilaceae bacterium]